MASHTSVRGAGPLREILSDPAVVRLGLFAAGLPLLLLMVAVLL
ncbi:hypothetical protein [Actinoplanes friuliensis]|jgi:hypothetical protein|nr:hypothetical protein [Actinoplanes friuliensis]